MTEPEIAFCHKTTSQLTAIKTFSHGVKQNMLFGILLTKMVGLFSCHLPKMCVTIISEVSSVFIKIAV